MTAFYVQVFRHCSLSQLYSTATCPDLLTNHEIAHSHKKQKQNACTLQGLIRQAAADRHAWPACPQSAKYHSDRLASLTPKGWQASTGPSAVGLPLLNLTAAKQGQRAGQAVRRGGMLGFTSGQTDHLGITTGARRCLQLDTPSNEDASFPPPPRNCRPTQPAGRLAAPLLRLAGGGTGGRSLLRHGTASLSLFACIHAEAQGLVEVQQGSAQSCIACCRRPAAQGQMQSRWDGLQCDGFNGSSTFHLQRLQIHATLLYELESLVTLLGLGLGLLSGCRHVGACGNCGALYAWAQDAVQRTSGGAVRRRPARAVGACRRLVAPWPCPTGPVRPASKAEPRSDTDARGPGLGRGPSHPRHACAGRVIRLGCSRDESKLVQVHNWSCR